jgi:Nucleotidyl transferase AbiEii toxin, Type IV TA system
MQVGSRVWESVKVEVVQDTELTCTPVLAPASPTAADAHGWTTMPYRTVHPADHVADKWAGMTEVQPSGASSSRFRDLLDLVTIVNSEVIDADDAIRACAQRRRRPGMTNHGNTLQIPAETWAAGYRRVAREAAKLGVPEASAFPEADAAVAFVAVFLNPVLLETATGVWSPELHKWQA